MKTVDDDRMLTRKETVAMLRVSMRTLERWVTAGLIVPAVAEPHLVRFRRGDVLRVIRHGLRAAAN